MSTNQKKLSLWTLVMLIFVPTFGFINITNNAAYLGPAAIPSWLIVAILFFLPLSIMFAEISAANTHKDGGLYTWIESGAGSKWAFIGTWSYFIGNLFYLQFVFSRIPVFASWAIFGENKFNDSNTIMLPMIAVVVCIILTWVSTKGVEKYSKLSNFGGKFTLATSVIFIVMAIVGFASGTPSQTDLSIETMTPTFDTAYFATFSWLLFAVAGAEIGGTYIKEVDNPKVTFPRGVFLAALFISISYLIGSVAVFLIASPETINEAGLKDASFVVYEMLAQNWGLNGKFVVQVYAIILTITSIAAYILWLESPVRAMFMEVPQETFPKFLRTKDESGTLKNALWTQCGVLIVLILIPLIGLETIDGFFKLITDLSALSLVIPYLVIAVAYLNFRLKNQDLEYTILKSKLSYMSASLLVFILASLGFFGAGLDYIQGVEDTFEVIKLIFVTYGGPIILIFVGIAIRYFNMKKVVTKSN